jgi:hypothetical protein
MALSTAQPACFDETARSGRNFVTDFISDGKIPKKPRCAYCKKAFTPPKRGRPPRYCSVALRQRDYEMRRALMAINIPSLLIGRDIDEMRTRAGIERAVLDVLRKLGMLPSAPPPPRRLRVVSSRDEEA